MQAYPEVLWSCPVCKAPLFAKDSGFACENSHHYDLAKQGYLNLLLANQKKSADPGDNAEMVQARREFLSQGHYGFLMECIVRLVGSEALTTPGKKLLDLGCGEGSYIKYIVDSSPDLRVHACDISKFAIKRASTYVQSANFAVASNYNIPAQSGSQDFVLAVFAPVKFNEVSRVLKAGGTFIRVVPGENHLIEIRRRLYDKVKNSESSPVLTPFSLVDEINESEKVVLQKGDLVNLLKMTPLYWQGDAEEKAKILAQNEMALTFDFSIQVMQC